MADELAPLAFIDLETTGLDPEWHEAWEIAWAFDDEPVEAMFLPHSGRWRDPGADEVNHYLERCPKWAQTSIAATCESRADREQAYLREARLEDRFARERPYLVTSAPSAVDVPFLRKRWNQSPWHHRTIDISTYAMPMLGHRRPMGLWRVATDLRERGYPITLPDHTAAADVVSLRECYRVLEVLSRAPQRWVLPMPTTELPPAGG